MPVKKSKVSAKKVSKVAKKKLSPLEIEVFDTKGKVKEVIKLPKEIFGAKINKMLLSQVVRVYLANQRRGTSSTKTRSEVIGSTKKIWRQKGTGRARHGSRKAPIFVGGGVAFGPKPRDYSLTISKKMKRLALFSALSSRLKDGQVKGVASLSTLPPKTKLVAGFLKNLGILEKERRIGLVVPPSKEGFENLYRAARNLEGVTLLSANMLTAYEVLDNKMIILSKEAIAVIEKTFLAKEQNEK